MMFYKIEGTRQCDKDTLAIAMKYRARLRAGHRPVCGHQYDNSVSGFTV